MFGRLFSKSKGSSGGPSDGGGGGDDAPAKKRKAYCGDPCIRITEIRVSMASMKATCSAGGVMISGRPPPKASRCVKHAGSQDYSARHCNQCQGPEPMPGSIWLEGCKFTDFKLGPILGTGSFGRVHLATHTPTGTLCATKSLSKASIVKTKQVLHVKQEKSILARISHPFVVNLLGYCQDEQCVHLVIEYVCGGEFFTYLRSTGRFDEQTTRFYASQVLCAFEYLHNMDIIYRDLKPENLLLDEKGNIKVTDFGFAKQIDRRTYTLCGTPDYLAPEIILNKGHGKPVDWWTFGVLIYEMLAGYPPFYDDDAVGTYQKILSGKVQFPGHFSRRIGCLKGGVKDIKTHAWFQTVDWDVVPCKKDIPPIRPKVSSKDDTSCFDDYSKLGPMKHEFVLSTDDQVLFKDL